MSETAATMSTELMLTNAELRAADPAAYLRKAAERMRTEAEAATPGRWSQMCMGSDGCQVHNDGRLRDRKHVAFFGRKEWKADHADAVYVAGMQPAVALAMVKLLEAVASDVEAVSATPACQHDSVGPAAYVEHFHEALDIAEACLGDRV